MRETTSILPGTHNAREVAGLPISGGGTLASGLIFRSDALASLTDAGLQSLNDLEIGTVIDLRTDSERDRAPDRLPTDGSVRLFALPMQGGAMDEMVKQMLPAAGRSGLSVTQLAEILQKVPTLEQLYIGILQDNAAQFAQVAQTVLSSFGADRPGVLIHCTAGKDRTGLSIAILLMLAEVPRSAIVGDYTQTTENLAGGFSEALTGLITSMGVPLTPAIKALATEAPASAIETAIDWIALNHGGAAAYLRSGGMTDEEITKLRHALRSE